MAEKKNKQELSRRIDGVDVKFAGSSANTHLTVDCHPFDLHPYSLRVRIPDGSVMGVMVFSPEKWLEFQSAIMGASFHFNDIFSEEGVE